MDRFIDLDEPCLDAGFGYENGDGYVRICDKPRNLGGLLVMRHRWFWETYIGPIPEGYEIDHLCKNRRCFNLKHLDCIPGSEHASKSNKERHKDWLSELKDRMDNGDLMGHSVKSIADVLQRPHGTVKKWVAKINQEETQCR